MPDATPAEPFRRRLFDVLERSRRSDALVGVVDLTLVTLIVANVVASVIETVPEVYAEYGKALTWFDDFCVTIFLIEYAARIWTAPEHPALSHLPPWKARLNHALSSAMLLDIIAISPFFIEIAMGADFTAVRILRIVRFFRLARYSPVLATIFGVIGAEWRALAGSIVVFAALILLSGAAMYLTEGSAQPEKFRDVPSAMWWAVVTISTVGYGDVVPVTPLGKLIAGVTMIFGVISFAIPIGIVATSFQERIRRRDFIVSFAMVARVPLFSRLDVTTIARLVGLLTARRVAEGEVIITKGERAEAMYFIAAGRVEVETVAGPVFLSEGDFFGEVALVTERARRTATVVAIRSCELLVLNARDFRHLMDTNAEIREAVREVARQRLGATQKMEEEAKAEPPED